jgi:hypothetical protein
MDELDFVKELIAGMTKVTLLSRTHRRMSRSVTAIAQASHRGTATRYRVYAAT